MILSERPRFRLLTLCALYLAQGIPFGFVTIALAAFLARKEFGLSEAEIGAMAAVALLPWSFKWAWGPLIDRFSARSYGRRRPWILFAQTMMALTTGAMLMIPEPASMLALLTGVLFVHNMFSSLQDVSVDALAVDLLSEDERGRANGFMYGSSYVGTAVGGAVLGGIAATVGLRAAMGTQLILLLLIMIIPLLARERRGDRRFPWESKPDVPAGGDPVVQAESIRALFAALRRGFSVRSTVIAGVLALGVKVASGCLAVVGLVVMIQRLGWSQQQFTAYVGGVGTFIGLGGAILGGYAADKVGAKRLASWMTILLGAVWILFALSSAWWMHKPVVLGFILLETLLVSALSVSLFSMFMTVSWPVIAATQFTAYMALLNLSNTLGTYLAGPLSEWFVDPHTRGLAGLVNIYALAGAFQAAMVFVLWAVDPHQTRRELGGADLEEVESPPALEVAPAGMDVGVPR